MQGDGIEGSNSKMAPISSIKAHSLNLNRPAYGHFCICKFYSQATPACVVPGGEGNIQQY